MNIRQPNIFWIGAVALFGMGLIAGPLNAEPKNEKPASDNGRILGAWEVVSGEHGGKDSPDFRGMRFVFTADVLKFMPKKETDDALAVKYKLDATKKPKHIDTSHELDRGKPIFQLGIYELDGDKLKFCWEAADRGRPSDFKTKAAGSSQSFILKRAAKDAK